MPRSWEISARAADDLDHIALGIARQNKSASLRFLQEAIETAAFVARWPGAGSIYRTRNPALAGLRKIRVRRFKNYLMFYRVRPKSVEILRIIHGARDIPMLLDDL